MHSLDDAVERIWNAAQTLLIQDFWRIEQKKRDDKSLYASLVGKENGDARGMIYAFFKNGGQVWDYTTDAMPVKHTDKFIEIFDDDFVKFLSRHLDENSDRARVIAPAAKTGAYHLVADAILIGYLKGARKNVTKLLDDPFERQESLISYFNNKRFHHALSKRKVQERLVPGAKYRHVATRAQAAMYLAIATDMPVIIVKQTVLPQPDYDLVEQVQDPVTKTMREVTYSRLGTGEMLLFGPRGLERRAALQIHPEAAEDFHVGAVVKRYRGQEQERFDSLPVVLAQRSYHFDESKRHVVPIDDKPVWIPKNQLSLYDLKS